MPDRPNVRRAARLAHPWPALLLLGAVLLLLGACSALVGDPSLTAPPSDLPSATPSATVAPSPDTRPGLPGSFPVMPGAVAAELPADPTVIASWTVDRVGSAAYDFYASALPRAGFRVAGLYPAERAAIIRFDAPDGEIWQLLAEQVGDGTRITVRTDRP